MSIAKLLNEPLLNRRRKIPRKVMAKMIQSGKFKVKVGGVEVTDFNQLYDDWVGLGQPDKIVHESVTAPSKGWPDGDNAYTRKFSRLERKTPTGNRMRSWRQSEGHCPYCGKTTPYEDWTLDHEPPICRGYRRSSGGLVGCCYTCNHSKGPLTADEFKQCPPKLRKEAISIVQSLLARKIFDFTFKFTRTKVEVEL